MEEGIVTEEPENLILVYLRRLDTKIDRLADDMREVKSRLGMLETQYANLSNQYASLSNRLDRLDGRVARIERRLDLAEV